MTGFKVVEIAINEFGYTEMPPNSNQTKYGKWFGLDGMAWCGMFVSYCYAFAGVPLERIGFRKGFAGCQTAMAHFKKTGQITDKPETGDIVFFDWNKDGRYDHTGIFIEWMDERKERFKTIEGNTSFTNNSNGGAVMYRERTIRNAIFVHPNVLDK